MVASIPRYRIDAYLVYDSLTLFSLFPFYSSPTSTPFTYYTGHRNIPNAAIQQQLHAQMMRDGKLHRKEPRSRVNAWAKFIVTQANFVFSLLSVAVLSGAIYALVADFGDLDKAFFLSYGLLFFFFGLIMMAMSYLGGQGVYYQRKESRFTSWSGPRILGIYQFFLVLGVCFELLWVVVSMDAFKLLRENADIVLANEPGVPTPAMTSLEAKLASKFNVFFFGAVSICDQIAYNWFWNFVNKRCSKFNTNMSQLSCQRCEDYSVTSCAADEKACYEGNSALQDIACPYQACRSGVLEYISFFFKPFVYFGLALFCFQFILVLSNCALICFHRRDTDSEIKAKNGIFAAKTGQTAGNAGQAHNSQYRDPESGNGLPMQRMERHAPNPNVPPHQQQSQFHTAAPPQHQQQQHRQAAPARGPPSATPQHFSPPPQQPQHEPQLHHQQQLQQHAPPPHAGGGPRAGPHAQPGPRGLSAGAGPASHPPRPTPPQRPGPRSAPPHHAPTGPHGPRGPPSGSHPPRPPTRS